MYDPIELVQVTNGVILHGFGVAAHSSMSAHTFPVPENPALHLQVNEPALLVHVAFVAQGFRSHSLISKNRIVVKFRNDWLFLINIRRTIFYFLTERALIIRYYAWLSFIVSIRI